MKSLGAINPFNKTVLSCAVSAAFAVATGLTATTANADIYEFSFDNGGCMPVPLPVPDPPPSTTCTGPGDAVFTMLDGNGKLFANKVLPYYSDATSWGYGSRTQIGGSVVLDKTQGTGTIAINPFDFVPASGAAVAHDITLIDIGDGSGGSGTLWLGNLLFDWSGNNGIPVSIVWDLQGVLGALPGLNINNIPDVANQVSGVGAVPASSGTTSKASGPIPIGAAPIATTAFDTSPVTLPADDIPLGTTPSGIEPVVTDLTLIGGSAMPTVPFRGFNANFDFTKLTLAGYNDTTVPVLTLGATAVNLAVGDAFDVNNPGISVTCLDNADGSDDLTASATTNANISFTVDDGNGGSTSAVNVNAAGTYEVLYTCTDNASARPAITEDPNNLGNPTVPVDNGSVTTTVLTVNVSSAGQPSINITNGSPTAHEACTVYTDAGATWTDPEDGGPFQVTDITDATPIIGVANEPNEGSYSVVYNTVDSSLLAATPQTRTVNVTDTVAPAITITGGGTVSIESSQATTYVSPSATAVDANGNCNPVIGGIATTSDVVNFVVPGGQDALDSTLRYFASDTANVPNQHQENQIVTVIRSEPVITLIGTASIVVNVGGAYTEQGMDIHDVQDGDLTAITTSGTTPGVGAGTGNLIHNIVIRDATSATIVSSIDTSVSGGRYTVSYDVTDSDTNTATQLTRDVSIGVFANNSNFTMLEKTGKTFGGTNDVVFDWDESLNTSITDTNFNMKISSATPTPFNGAVWVAHDVRAFGEGTYYIETDNAVCTIQVLQNTGCPGTAGSPTSIKMVVGPNQVGAHILFDWNRVENIDVVNVWDRDAVWDNFGDIAPRNALFLGVNGIPPSIVDPWKLVSTAQFTDGIGSVHGSPMIDGPFQGFYANFNAGPGGVGKALPPITAKATDTSLGGSSMSIWTMLTGLFTLLGLRVVSRKAGR